MDKLVTLQGLAAEIKFLRREIREVKEANERNIKRIVSLIKKHIEEG